MKFWEYLAERQKQRTIRKIVEKENQRIESIMRNNSHGNAIELLSKTEGTMQKYLKLVLDKEAE